MCNLKPVFGDLVVFKGCYSIWDEWLFNYPRQDCKRSAVKFYLWASDKAKLVRYEKDHRTFDVLSIAHQPTKLSFAQAKPASSPPENLWIEGWCFGLVSRYVTQRLVRNPQKLMSSKKASSTRGGGPCQRGLMSRRKNLDFCYVVIVCQITSRHFVSAHKRNKPQQRYLMGWSGLRAFTPHLTCQPLLFVFPTIGSAKTTAIV